MLNNKLLPKLILAAIMSVFVTTLAMASHHGEEKMDKSIVDIAVASEDFSTLVAALTAADLVETLQGDGPFTVLAPTNEAFEKLPEGTIETLLKPENKDQLIAILTYHVIAGKVGAADVATLESATTVNGATVKISVTDGNVKIGDATVTTADIDARNGVIHVIDAVLLP